MKDGFYRQTHRVERDHWWFVYRRRLAVELLRRSGFDPRPGARALDVGCGSGGNLEAIRSLGVEVVGLDRSSLALGLARGDRTDGALVRGDANGLAELFPPGCFDLVTLFNVLYHEWIADDRRVVEQAAGLLRPGGFLLLTEPAFRFLRRAHDRVDFGARRYAPGGLRSMVEGAGLRVVRATHFNAVAMLPAALAAAADRLRGDGEEGEETAEIKQPPRSINTIVRAICRFELSIIHSLGGLPFGVTILMLARRDPPPQGDDTAGAGGRRAGSLKSG